MPQAKTKPRKAPAKKQPAPRKVPPRAPESLSPDETVQVGFFAKAVDGPHAGRYGVVHSQNNDFTVLRTRDAEDEMLLVDPRHLRPDTSGRR